MNLLECITIEPEQPAKASVIWLHGLGADGSDFVPIVPELKLPKECAIRFVFPHAPMRPVTINQGYVMRAWYDILGLNLQMQEDKAGIMESQQAVIKLIEAEHASGIAYENIYLAGFSQGGAMALYTGLCFDKKLAGIIALSSYIPLRDEFISHKHQANAKTPIFMAHGTMDEVVPIMLGQWSQQFLEGANYPISWHTYPVGHCACAEEILDIGKGLT